MGIPPDISVLINLAIIGLIALIGGVGYLIYYLIEHLRFI